MRPIRHLALGRIVLLLSLLPAMACIEGQKGSVEDGGAALIDIGLCKPSCAGKACGADDGCGRPCSTGGCAEGARCEAGKCVCDAETCPQGCCEGGTCYEGVSDDLCGSGGTQCKDCAESNDSCGAEQACILCTPQCTADGACGAANSCGGVCSSGVCPAGQECQGGKCLCTPSSCPVGCCDSSQTCHVELSDGYCGALGAACSDCTLSTQACSLTAQHCRGCDSWEERFPDARLYSAAVDGDGTILAAGEQRSKLKIVRLDACGRFEKEVQHLPPTESKIGGLKVALVGDELAVAGYAKGASRTDDDGYHAMFRKDTLAPVGGPGRIEESDAGRFVSMRVDGDRAHLIGFRTVDGQRVSWGRVSSGATSCDFAPWVGAVGGSGRSLVVDHASGYVYYAIITDNKTRIVRVPSQSCTGQDCAGCTADSGWAVEFRVKDASGEQRYTYPLDMVQVKSALFVVGYLLRDTSTDVKTAFVAKIDIETQQVVGEAIYAYGADTSTLFDVVTADDQCVYIAGGRAVEGWDGGEGVLAVYRTSDLRQDRIVPHVDVGTRFRDVHLLGADGLLLVAGGTALDASGNAESRATIKRMPFVPCR